MSTRLNTALIPTKVKADSADALERKIFLAQRLKIAEREFRDASEKLELLLSRDVGLPPPRRGLFGALMARL